MDENEILTDEDFQPKEVKKARNRKRTEKRKRLNAIYMVIKDINGRDNALHAEQIMKIVDKRFNIKDISRPDITEACNRLREMGRLPFLLSERAHGIYNASNITESKVGLYEVAQMVKGYYNRWLVLRDLFNEKYGFGIIPNDPFDYKDEIGRELRGDEYEFD